MGLFEPIERWVAVTEEPRECPECGGDMEESYARDPAFQDHWRGSPAWVCQECEYAERRDA